MSLHAAAGAVGEQIEATARQRMSGLTRIVIVLGWPVRHWRTTITAVLAALCWRLASRAGHPGWWGLVALAAVPVLVLGVWAAAHLPSFREVAWPFVRAWWRRWFVYAPAWRLWMVRCRLTVRDENGRHVIPKLVRVESTPAIDRLFVHVPIGATPDDLARTADHLANAARA